MKRQPTERQVALLNALKEGPIMDDTANNRFYRLGGSGHVAIRYDARTLPAMARKGWVRREGSIYRSTQP